MTLSSNKEAYETRTTYYVAQERAMAPGIVRDWPKVIPHPTDKNGRLVNATDEIEALRADLATLGRRLGDADCGNLAGCTHVIRRCRRHHQEFLYRREIDALRAEHDNLKRTAAFMEEQYLMSHGGNWGECKYQSEAVALRAERDALAKVVAKLPRTQDGVPVTTNDLAWFIRNDELYAGRVVLPTPNGWMRIGPIIADDFEEFDSDSASPSVYSTREAALAAQEKSRP